MAKKKEKGENSSVFEIIVVLAIVAIVAVTGQVLIFYEKGGSLDLGSGGSSGSMTGFVVAGGTAEEAAPEEFLDLSISSIDINPPGPMIGESFTVRIEVLNEGKARISTPFYVEAELLPSGNNVKATVVNHVVTQVLEPGEKAIVAFDIATVTKEGPMKITATADSTFKLDDGNTANNQRTKTIIINS